MIDLGFQFKRFVGRSPTLYKLVQHFLHGRPHSIVTNRTVMCLEGYPRSANTFSLNLIRGALVKHYPMFFATHAERLIAHHTHRIATVKAAQHYGIPTLVLLRSPDDAIPSRVVRESAITTHEERTIIRRALKEYHDFYGYMIACGNIDIIRFGTVISEPQTFVEFTLKSIGLKVPEEMEIDSIREFAKDSIEYWGGKRMAHNALTENFSNERKAAKKSQVQDKIEQQYPEAHLRAESIYSNLAREAQI